MLPVLALSRRCGGASWTRMSGCGASTWAPRASSCSALRYGWCLAVRPVSGCDLPPEWSIAERRAWAGLLFLTLVFVNFAEVAWWRSAPSRFAARSNRGIAFAVFHVEPVRAADRLGSGGRRAARAADGAVELDERDLRMQRSADRAGDWALTTSSSSQSYSLLAFVPAERLALVAVAADRRECADRPPDREIVRRACLPGGALRAANADDASSRFAIDIRSGASRAPK